MQAIGSSLIRQGRPRVILADAIFLAIMAIFGLTQDLLSYFWGVGRFDAFLFEDSRAIGFVEAHGLAGVIAVAALLTASHRPIVWHALLGFVHAFLGSCNLIFFSGFIETGESELAIAVTVAHFGFAAAHAGLIYNSCRTLTNRDGPDERG